MAVLTWGESTWNNLNGFGGNTNISESVTGVAATSSVGSASKQENANVTVTGVVGRFTLH